MIYTFDSKPLETLSSEELDALCRFDGEFPKDGNTAVSDFIKLCIEDGVKREAETTALLKSLLPYDCDDPIIVEGEKP